MPKLDDKKRLHYMAQVMLTARRLRDVSRNLLLKDTDALAAWEALNRAIVDKDHYLETGLDNSR